MVINKYFECLNALIKSSTNTLQQGCLAEFLTLQIKVLYSLEEKLQACTVTINT